ncbi:hypothetical protein FNW52_02665 [Flavobacterium sp. ZT3R18]|uniref:hypothetical protein n=1 Tax=Flavobacterium sp. ZT3R18 TaxID=2594429 RepID=UPI00117AFCF5|nr:hypothetical protein [Flavobacterium sp. ZT3R18]TRX37818.1 hypothetical protein FNW52_02665 [Flavobacterium sp. ZT3R18]
MTDKLIEIIVEKGLLAIIIALAGFWISKYLEIDKQRITLQNKIKETNRDKIYSQIEKQLSNFYYPIYFRLQKDNALWKLSPQLSGSKDALPQETNDIIEKDYILKNHNEILSTIQNNIHFVEIDNELQESINAYIKHVTVYDTIRKINSTSKLNPIDFDAPYPNSFVEIIKARMTILQKKNNELLNEI